MWGRHRPRNADRGQPATLIARGPLVTVVTLVSSAPLDTYVGSATTAGLANLIALSSRASRGNLGAEVTPAPGAAGLAAALILPFILAARAPTAGRRSAATTRQQPLEHRRTVAVHGPMQDCGQRCRIGGIVGQGTQHHSHVGLWHPGLCHGLAQRDVLEGIGGHFGPHLMQVLIYDLLSQAETGGLGLAQFGAVALDHVHGDLDILVQEQR